MKKWKIIGSTKQKSVEKVNENLTISIHFFCKYLQYEESVLCLGISSKKVLRNVKKTDQNLILP